MKIKLWLTTLCAAVFLLSGCGDRRSDQQRIADAQQSIANSRFRDAIIEMRSLLRAQPGNAAARAALGQALMSVGDMAAAEKEYERAREAGALPDVYLEPLTRAWQSRGAHHEVLADVNPLAVDDPALVSTLRALSARSLLALGSRDEAARLFDSVLQADLSDEAKRIALLGKATIARELDDNAQAEAFLREALEINPGAAESVLELGRFYLDQQDYPAAKALLTNVRDTQMRARRQDWFNVEAQLTEALLGLGELEAARESAATLTSLSRTHPMAAYLQGRVELDSGNLNQAVQYFQQVLAVYPNYAPALTLMGVTMIDLADFDRAELHLSEAVAADPNNVQTRRLLAETRMRMGRSSAAVSTLKAGLRNSSADSQMITMLGRESLRLGEKTDGLRYLNEALAASPDNLQANLALAQAYLSDGDTDQAVSILRDLPASSISDARRRVLIKVAQIDRSDVGVAQTQIETLLAESPGDVYVMGLAGSFFSAIGELTRAREFFNQILAASPGNRSAMLSVLNLDERDGDYTQSKALFETAHANNPDDLLPMLVLARIYDSLGEPDRSMEFVRQAHQSHPLAMLPNLLLAAEEMHEGQIESAEDRVELTLENYPKSARAHALGGQIKMALTKVDEAIASYRRAVLYDAQNAEYRYYLGQAEWAAQRYRQARNSFRDALARDPTHIGAMRAVGMLEARAGKDAQADLMAQAIVDAYGDKRRALLARADIRAAQERIADAIDLYERAAQLSLSWPVSKRLYQLRRQYKLDEPLASLMRWLEREPDDTAALLTLAQAYQRQGNAPEAIKTYERVLALEPDVSLALNNLAWLYLEQSDTERAVSAARRAYRAAPENVDIVDTYGWMLVRDDQVSEGRDILRAALLSTSPAQSPDIAYHYAATLSRTSDRGQMRELLAEALESERPFAGRKAAQTLLDSM